MKFFTSLKVLFVTLIVASGLTSFAQQGTIKGVITDENGLVVPGASIMIEEINKGAVSNFDGNFTILKIPEGSYNLTAKYLGFQTVQQQVMVVGGETVAIDLVLNSSNTLLESVQLLGSGLNSQAKALNTQRNKTNITNIVSTEQIGKFPDANIGDAAKRIPGITMQVDQGEARDIIIRGLAPHLNSVTLNGSRIPSAEGDNRNVQMDLIPADMIQTIEVNKAVTPDMDADALGGSVNLITRAAPQSFRLSASAGSGINLINDKRILSGSFLLGDRIGNGKFGYMISASINDNDFGSDNIEAEWSNEFEYNTGMQDGDGEDILEELEVNPYANVTEIRKYLVQRVRRSFSANFDYNFNENHSLYFKSIYNWRDDRENRFAYGTEILDGEDIGPDDFEISNGNLVRFPVEAYRENKGGISGGRSRNRRLEDQRMQNYSLGGEHLFGNVKFDWMGSYALASEEKPNERSIGYTSEYQVLNNFSNPEKPRHAAIGSPAPGDFELDELAEESSFTQEDDINVFVNLEVPSDLFGAGDGFLKFGLRGRLKNKERDNFFTEYEPLSGLATLADVALTRYDGDGFLAGDNYRPGFFASAAFLGELDLTDQNLFEGEVIPDEFLGENFSVTENVYAAYLMTNQKLTSRLSVLAGIRMETTAIESAGNEIIFDDEGDFQAANRLQDESTYTNLLPGVHIKYDVSEATILRFAWTNTLARPNYIDLAPFRSINNEDREIVLGNTELNPTTSMNLDFMAEKYFGSVGLLSAGAFYKKIDDFIYVFVTEDEATGYDLFQPFNGENAEVYGAEVSFQRQLDFLPGFAKNFGVFLNYTYVYSESQGIRNEDGDERGDLALPGSSPNMFNASLSYSDRRFNARISANFSDDYLNELGENPFEDRFYGEQFFLDLNTSYSINKNLQIYATMNNITNQPLRFYQGIKERTMQLEYYNARLTFGLKYNLF